MQTRTGKEEKANITSRVSAHMFVAHCDNNKADACNHHKFFNLCNNLVALYDNTGADTAVFELVAPRNNLSSTYSGRVPVLPVLPRGVVALCNNLVTPCDNVVEHVRGPTPDGGKGAAPERDAR